MAEQIFGDLPLEAKIRRILQLTDDAGGGQRNALHILATEVQRLQDRVTALESAKAGKEGAQEYSAAEMPKDFIHGKSINLIKGG